MSDRKSNAKKAPKVGKRSVRTAAAVLAMASALIVGGALPLSPVAVASAATMAAPPPPPPPPPPPGFDDRAPIARIPAHVIFTSSFSSVPIRASWSATDASVITKYEARLLTYPGPTITTIRLSSTTATAVNLRLKVGKSYRISIRATDAFGNRSAWKNGPVIKPTNVEQSSSSVTFRGTWKTVRSAAASGGSYRSSSATRASVSHKFSGRHIAIVARTAPSSGSAKVYIDGRFIGTISFKSSTTANKVIVFSRRVTAGTHSIKVVRNSGSIAIDAFIRVAS